MNGQTPSSPGGAWVSYLTPNISAAMGARDEIPRVPTFAESFRSITNPEQRRTSGGTGRWKCPLHLG